VTTYTLISRPPTPKPAVGEEGGPATTSSGPDGVDVVTFGCRLNAYESEAIRARASADGLSDAVVFNTCAVTNEAVRQARQAIRKARRERPDARLIVTGCAAQIDPAAFAAMPEVDLVLGNAEKAAPGALLDTSTRVRVNDIMSIKETAGHLIAGLKDRPGPMSRSRTAATTAAPSASSPTAGAIRARPRPAKWSSRCAAWPPRAITRWC
jgi:threonylcarbamoyladenosine tRNA methylthiotransferase MtaB